MKISLYDRPPVLDTEGAFDDSDLLQRFEQRAMEFNRPGGFVDALRKGTAGLLRSFVAPNNIEADSLTALIGNEQERLNDPIGREMSQAQWDAYMRENAQSAANPNFFGLRSLADYIEPTPHAEPDNLLGKAAYKAGEYIPGIAGSVAEFMTLGPWGTILLNTVLGGQASQQQVYENQLAQGKSTQEARDIAEGFLGNAADFAVRGGTNLATLWALGRAYPGFQSGISPVGHTLRNIGLASGISGAGAMGEEAITNYRSDKDNNLGNLAETGATSAATTGIIGLTLAGLRAKKLIEAQREYNAYQGLHNVEWRDITPPDAPDEPLGLGGSNNPQPPNNPPQSPNGTLALPQGTLQLPEFTTRNIAARLNKAVTQRGFNPITNDFQPNALARQIAAHVGNGFMSMDDALSMLQEGGLSPDDAKGFLDTGIAEILERTRVPETPKQPTEITLDRIANHPDTQSYRRFYEGYANLDETYSDFGGDNSTPLQDFPDTFTYSPITNPYPTPADFLADMKAKKRQAQSQIRRMEKNFPPQTTDITEQDKEKEYTSAERKIDKSQARVQDANEQFSSIKQPSEKKSIFQNLRVLLERNDMYQGGNLSGKKKQQPTPEQRTQTPTLTAWGTNEAFYDDDYYSDNYPTKNNGLISPQDQDIPETHLPDTQQETPRLTALSFKPNIDKPNVSHFKPDMQDVTASRFSPNVDKPAISHISPELQKPNVVRGLDGLEDILQPPQRLTALSGQPQDTQQKPNADITFDEALRKVAEILYQPYSENLDSDQWFNGKNFDDYFSNLPLDLQKKIDSYMEQNPIISMKLNMLDDGNNTLMYRIDNLDALKDILQNFQHETNKNYPADLPAKIVQEKFFYNIEKLLSELNPAQLKDFANSEHINIDNTSDDLLSSNIASVIQNRLRLLRNGENIQGISDTPIVRAFREAAQQKTARPEPQAPTLTALGDTQQQKSESGGIVEDLKNIVENTRQQQSKTKLQPIGKPFLDVKDVLGRVKQVTNPEAVKIRNKNLQLLNDAKNDEERIRLLNTLTHQQLKDMHDSGAFSVNYYQGQSKKDYIASIIEHRNRRQEELRREEERKKKHEQTTAQEQEHFISIGDITNASLRNEQNIPNRLNDIDAYDKRHDEYNEAVRKATLHNEQLFRSVDSPEKLTAMLREVNNDTGITPPSGVTPSLNRPIEQQIASLVLSRFPDYQPAKDALRIPVLQPVALYYSGNKNPLSGNQGWTSEVANSDRKNFKERFDSNIRALESLSDESDIIKALHTLDDKDIFAMAKELGLRIDKRNPARSFARLLLKLRAEKQSNTPKTAPAPNPDIRIPHDAYLKDGILAFSYYPEGSKRKQDARFTASIASTQGGYKSIRLKSKKFGEYAYYPDFDEFKYKGNNPEGEKLLPTVKKEFLRQIQNFYVDRDQNSNGLPVLEKGDIAIQGSNSRFQTQDAIILRPRNLNHNDGKFEVIAISNNGDFAGTLAHHGTFEGHSYIPPKNSHFSKEYVDQLEQLIRSELRKKFSIIPERAVIKNKNGYIDISDMAPPYGSEVRITRDNSKFTVIPHPKSRFFTFHMQNSKKKKPYAYYYPDTDSFMLEEDERDRGLIHMLEKRFREKIKDFYYGGDEDTQQPQQDSKSVTPQAETTAPQAQEAEPNHSAPVITDTSMGNAYTWNVTVNGQGFHVYPYGASNMGKFREWLITPFGSKHLDEQMIYDAYLDKALFTEFPDDDTKKSSNTPAAVDAIRQTLTDLYRKNHGETYSDKQSKPKPENNSPVRGVSFNDKQENEKQPEQQTQKSLEPDTQSSGKRIIPDGAILKEGSFTAKGHFHREVMYKVKPAKRDYIHKIADVLEIKSGIEPPFVYIPEHDLFSSDGNSHTGKELKSYVEKAFREHLNEFYELPKEQSTEKHSEPDTASNNSSMPDTPITRLANRVKSRILEALDEDKDITPFSNDDLREWATQEFGGTLGQGAYTQKQAYDAMEMGINLAIAQSGITPATAEDTHDAVNDIQRLLRILQVIPTQTNRDKEQVAFQQFSTPPTLAYLVNWLANIGKNNIALEPSAGTGNLAVFAHNAGAKLILNDYSTSGLRADILDVLGWGKVYREDAMQLGNILAGEVREGERSENDMPDRVVMNPPFSSAGNLGGNNKNQNGFKHVMSALQVLKHGGRLVTILGAGRDGNASSVKTWLKHIGKVYNVRALITVGGKAYQKYGTTFSNAILVIDNTGSTPKDGTVEFAFSGDFSNDEEVRKLFEAMQAIRNDIHDGDNSQPNNDSNPPKPEPPKPAPAPKNDTPKAEAKNETTAPEKSDIPDTIRNNPALKAIHDYLDGNTDLTLKIDEAIRASMEANFRYNLQKERQIQEAISLALGSAGFEMDENTRMTRHIYKLVRNNQGYDDEHHIIATENPKKEWEGFAHDRLKQEEATAKTAELVEKVKAAKNEQEIKAILGSVNLHSITGILEGIVGRLYRQASGITSSMNRQQVVERALNTIMDSLHGKPSSEFVLNHLEEFSFFSLKEYAKDFGIDVEATIGGKDDSEANRAKLRSAIKKALKADTKPVTQENQTQQEHIQPENNTQTDTDNNAEAPKKITVSRKSSKELDNERKALREHDEDNSIQSTYTPTIITQGAKHHPADLVESTVMASISLPNVSKKPNILQFIIDEGRLSDAQMEAVTLAVNSFSHILPNGYRRGFFIGDGTGVGKGREISGIIMDTLSRGAGNGKAIWISNGHTLIMDAKRDWQGLGNNPDDIFPQKGFKAKNPIQQKKGILFTAYSHMASKDRIKQLKEWLGENWDGIIVLDEAHNANNVLGGNAATRAKNTRDFIKAFPKARVLYVSATGATKMENFAMLDRLGIWGYDDAPFENAKAFNDQLSKGGIAAMEVAARDFKAMGLFIARSLSMRAGPYGGNENVTFRTLEHKLTDDEIEIYDSLAEIWQMVEQEMPRIMIARGYDPKKGKDIAKWKSVFWGAHQRFFNQIITSFQTDEAILDIQKQLDAGNSCLVQLTNTLEANLNRAIKKGKQLNNDDDDSADSDFDLSPKDILIEMVNNLFDPRVVQYTTNEDGDEIVEEVKDSSGKPVLSDAVLRKKQTFLDLINSINRFPQSPIDKILNFFGHENVAEITGRSQRPRVFVDKKTGKKSNLESGRTDSVRNAEIDDYNSGKRRILIFSEKGGTGASYHASNDYENKQKRIHYLLQAGWAADKALQGLGRSNRSNEAHKPEYILVTTDIPGQKRFISTIAKRLAQLGALTTGERRTATSGMFSEGDNLEASYVTTALGRFIGHLLAPLTSRENPYPELDPEDVMTQLGYSEEKIKKIDVTDFLNRLLAMTVDMQKMVFARFQQEIDTVKEIYLANGTDIDAPAENVKAISINIIKEQTINHSDLFGTDTNYLELEITRNMNPRTWQEIQSQMNIGVKYRFYALGSGKIVAAVRSGRTYDTETQQMITTYRLVQPDRRKVEYGLTDKILSNSDHKQKRKFTPVDVNTAQTLWMTQTDELPDTFTATEHMITGAMLPVWNLIEDHPKVWRITTEDGRKFLGRIIPNKQLQKVLQALHVKFEGKKYNADSIKKVLDKRGTIVTLLNKAKLKFSRVSGEKLLEIIPADVFMGRALKRAGLISMIINSKERFFFPKGNDELLNKYLEQYPVAGEPVEIDDADEIIAEAVDTINSSIDASDSGHLHIIHPSFWGFINDPDDNPLIHESNYPMDSEPREYRYQKSKEADSSKSVWQHIKEFGAKIWKGRHDIPELADEKGEIDDSLIKAQEWLRGLKRERQANVHETEKQLRSILLSLTPDDFDLFQRAMELRDLNETHSNDPNADMPWDLNPPVFSMRDPVRENFANIMGHVRKNPRVQEAMKKSDILMEDIRKKLVEAADRLGMFDVRDRLSRKYYFRHLVLEYYNMQRSGKPHPTFKNPTARGYMKHREGSEKDISSNWILAMGEVFTRMFDDIKILDTLFKLREEYDIIEDIRQQALNYNMENALARIMRGLQDVPEDLRKAAAEKKLCVALNTTQARAMTRLLNLAKKGDLPVGNKHEWEDLVSRMAEAGQLEKLSQDEQQTLARYIGWLSDLPSSTPARKAAKTFLTGIKSRIRALKSIVGDDYLDWQDLIPEDYTIWSPSDSRLIFSASTLPEYMLKIATENIDALLGADASDIGKMIASGGDKQIWVIPTRLANALDNIGKSQPMGAFGQIMTKMMGAFKQWVTISPVNGRLFKYNWRNFFGDLEAVLQGNPGALYYFKQAAKELTDIMLRGGIATGTLEEFQKRGGGLTTEAMTELERPDRIKEFSHLFEQKKSSNPLKWGVKALREYLYIATTLTNFRESILRYASFLSYIQLIKDNNGVPPFYGMSKPREVKAVGDDIYDIAFKLANENLGAYDQISNNLQWLRDNNFASFLSWVEVNTKRYFRLMANVWQGNSYLEWWIKRKGQKFIDGLIGGGNGGNNEPPKNNNGGNFADDDGDNEFRKIFRRVAKKSGVGALRLAITLALAAPLWGLLYLWNMLNSENDEKLPPDVRNKPHLTLNTNPFTGEVLYLGDIGSAFDALNMFGVGNLITGDLRDLFDGRTSFGQLVTNILDGPVSKIVSNANPFAKAIVEAALGKRTFPSALHPTPIRDKGRFIAQSFGLEWYYDFLTDKPHKPFYDFSSSVVNSSNQDSSAYFYMLSRRKQFEENVLGKSVDAFTITRRGEALRNAKRAADLGDGKSLRKYLREYFRAGGSEQGLKISARTMEPLYGLNDTDEMRFIRWLPKEERKILRRAMRYAERMKARLGVW